jgi:anti-sigma B factor antagonist
MTGQDENTALNPNPFEIAGEELDGVFVIAVNGELDLNTAPRLEQRLDEAPADDGAGLLIDLSGCEFIDSTGIGLIVRAWRRLDANADHDGKGGFALCGLSDQVRRLLDITGLKSSIRVYADREAALAELRAG